MDKKCFYACVLSRRAEYDMESDVCTCHNPEYKHFFNAEGKTVKKGQW